MFCPAQGWLPPDIKQEEEEEEQAVTQRGELLDFTDQDHYKSEMEDQNPEHHTDNPVNREEPDSASATTHTQVSVHDVMIKPAS